MWNEEIISTKKPRLMITVGTGWQNIIKVFLEEQGQYLHTHDQKRVFCVSNIHEAAALISQFEDGKLELISPPGIKK
jgi:hypothetical protein